MEPEREPFRARLLASESWESPARERYEQAVSDLLSRKLTPAQRGAFGLLAVVLPCTAAAFVWLAATQGQLPVLGRILFLESALFAIVGAGYLDAVLRRGEFHRRRMPSFIAGLMWIFAVLLSIHFVALIPFIKNVSVAVHLLGLAMIVLIGAALQLLRTCIEQSELNTHERMLEVLCRLAEETPESDAKSR